MKYQAMSETVLKAVGGKENITSVTHCATRLRIDARDTSIIDLQLAKSADQALGAVVSGGQLQVIIGPTVTEAYNDSSTSRESKSAVARLPTMPKPPKTLQKALKAVTPPWA